MKPRLLPPLPALCALCVMAIAPATARAEALASVQLSHFGWSLEDLRPDDGIAPALTLPAVLGSSWLAVDVGEQSVRPPFLPPEQRSFYRDFFGSFPSVQASVALPHATSSADFGGDVGTHGYGARLQGRAVGSVQDTRYFSFSSSAGLASPEWDRLPMVLTPFTRLVWSGDVSVAASVSRFPGGERLEQAYALFQAQMLDAADARLVSELVEERVIASSNDPRFPTDGQLDFPLRLAWDNDSARPGAAWLVLYMTISGDAIPMSPVPEPATWALLAGGLGVVGGVAARRRPRPEAPGA